MTILPGRFSRGEFGYGDSDESTTLRIRPDGQGRTRTFYFRREFYVDDPTEFAELHLGLLRDDGAAVYLNGEEIIRDNLRAEAAYDDFARSSVGGDEESTYFPFTVATKLLRPGRNLLAVEVHQVSDTSSDVSFDLELHGIKMDSGELQLVSAGSEWRFLDDGSDQGTQWQASDFDDSNWSRGQGQFGYGDAPGTVHVAIGPEDWFGDSAGGVAFVGSFDLDDRTVVFAFTNGFGPSGKNIAEVATHETGHAFGLRHQSVYDADTGEKIEEYNPGQGDWAPIMGNSYSPSLTTWHDGPAGSNGTPQDDMSRIARNANGFGYRADDYGNDANSATPLTDDSSTEIAISGIIERNTDRDVFTFSLEEGQGGISIQANGVALGANLDAVLEIRDHNDQVVVADDPAGSYDAGIATTLEPGDYTVVIRSNGEYGRVGQYTLTGKIDEPPTTMELESLAPVALEAAAGNLNGTTNFAGDLDSFFVAADSGDMIGVVVTPAERRARLSVSMPGQDQTISGRRGQPVVLPLTAVDEDGTLQIDVMGDRVTDYTIQIGRNVMFEATDTDDGNPATLPALNISGGRASVLGHLEQRLDTSTLVSSTSLWQYLDDGSDQGESWRAASYDDSGWQTSRGEFGYGDNDERTRLRQQDASGQRIRTFYFRHRFEVSNVALAAGLSLDLKFDDGMAVYLNGREVARENLAVLAGYRDVALSSISNEGDYRSYEIDPALLREGENVLAVEVHQVSDSSSDVSMAARLDVSRAHAAVDTYLFEVTDTRPHSLLLRGRDVGLGNQKLEILSNNSQDVLMTATASSPSFDLGIRDWTPPALGSYVARLSSTVCGRLRAERGGQSSYCPTRG